MADRSNDEMFPSNYEEQSVHYISLNCEKSLYCPTLTETNNHPDAGKLPNYLAESSATVQILASDNIEKNTSMPLAS